MGLRPKLVNFSDLSEGREFLFSNPIGHRKNGDPIFMIAGGSGEDEDEDEDEGTNRSTVSIAKYLKLQTRMKAADRRANAAEQQVADLKPIAEKVPDLEKQLEDQRSTVSKLRIDNAFLTASGVQWHDPEAALRLVDMTDVQIKDDGTVVGLKEALEKLAKDKPYLVKPEKEEPKKSKSKKDEDEGDEDEDDDLDEEGEDDDDEDDGSADEDDDDEPPARKGGKVGGVSGTGTGSGRKRKGRKGPTDEELMRQYRI